MEKARLMEIDADEKVNPLDKIQATFDKLETA